MGFIDIESLLDAHGAMLLALARRYSANPADAEDAFQNAVEKLLSRKPKDAGHLGAWMATVVRNEALMIRRKRGIRSHADIFDPANESPDTARTPEESLLAEEHTGFELEALKRLHPDQLRCIVLRADGLGYPDIARLTGFSQAKVQRSIWLARKQFRAQVSRSEQGRECVRIEPMLSAFVDGALVDAQRSDIELHLRGCLACRATVREYRRAPADIAALLPIGGVAATGERHFDGLARVLENFAAWVNERAAVVMGSSHGTELAFVKKAALVTAAAASVTAGGVAVERALEPADVRDRSAQRVILDERGIANRDDPSAGRARSDSRGSRRARSADKAPRASAAEVVGAPASEEASSGTAQRQVTPEPNPVDAVPLDNAPVDDGGTDEELFE